jgi:hypothetical protein
MDEDERFLCRVRAAAVSHPGSLVFSHMSAARLWDLPVFGSWPDRPHVTTVGHVHRGSTTLLTRTMVEAAFETTVMDALEVTALPRTVIDVARTRPLSVALSMADHALRAHALQHSALTQELAQATLRGRAAARIVVELADGASASVGESVSRAGMHLCGFAPPQLQVPFTDEEGTMFADFYWPELGLIGEFDGKGKYLKPEYLGRLTPGEAVWFEKRREDRLRALGPRVTRWDWRIARTLPTLRAHLARAGLRPTR